VKGINPWRANPTNVTCLKMTGRQREEQVAERLRKPVSGTVASGVGPTGQRHFGFRIKVDGFLVKQEERGLSLPVCVEGARNPMRVVLG
jgi:hypothetical protein